MKEENNYIDKSFTRKAQSEAIFTESEEFLVRRESEGAKDKVKTG